MNIIPEAWGGNYPYQVKVEPLTKIIPLKDAKKLLFSLNVGRSSPISKDKTLTILELYRPATVSINQWFEFLSEPQKEKSLEISAEPKSWQMFAHSKSVKKNNDS